MKAQGLLAREIPQLRRLYMGWPWGHFYEHPFSVTILAIARLHEGEPRLCWGRFIEPEARSLVDLQAELDGYRTGEPAEMFKNQFLLAKQPRLLRRFVLWCNMNLSGPRRAKRLGTFSMTMLAAQGCISRVAPTLQTTNLSYGPISDEGVTAVTVTGDHRVADGLAAVAGLRKLEKILRGPILDELCALAKPDEQLEQAA